MRHYPVTPPGVRINNQTSFGQHLQASYHWKNIWRLCLMAVIRSECFNNTFWAPLKEHVSWDNALFVVHSLEICHLRSLIESDLSHLICQQNWQFASRLKHLTGRGRFISPFVRELMEVSHARLHMVRGSAAADKTCEKAAISRWFTQFGAKSGTAVECLDCRVLSRIAHMRNPWIIMVKRLDMIFWVSFKTCQKLTVWVFRWSETQKSIVVGVWTVFQCYLHYLVL